jgi:hypothetical protein
VEPSAHEPLADVPFVEFPDAILTFLNAGGTPEELTAELLLLGVGLEGGPVVTDDFTGDGRIDVAVSIHNTSSPPQGALVVYTCQDGGYVPSYLFLSDPAYQTPEVILVQDLNADIQNELVISSRTCGAHTCYYDVRILSWNGVEMENKLQGTTTDLPYPNIQVTDFDGDGIYAFEATGTAIGAVGAGPQRDRIRVWEYDPATGYWAFSSETLGPSEFRIHVVHDADAAMRRGEYLIAALLYQQVIEDDALKDWMDFSLERAYLSAYAYFKRVVAASFLGELDEANELLEEMARLYIETDQQGYVELAGDFVEAFLTGGEEAGCAAAHEYAALNPELILDPLGSSVFGYANPDYAPEDICP